MGTEQASAPPGGSAVTIGAYDGVHLGHREVIGHLRERAAALGLESVVVTFDRHPAAVVRPESVPPLLTDLDQKLELLASTGVDMTLVVPFDADRAEESPEDFVDEVLLGALGARVVVVGENFHFGHGRKGDVPMLAELGRSAGFEVVGLALASSSDGHPVSSTRIRGLLARGDVVGAARLLGREHQVRGKVVAGDGRGGAELGFPTANVDLPAGLALPEEGIYACRYERPDRSTHMAAVSLGRRPTFYDAGSPSLLEAYLLDFSGDLYGELAKVSFVARLRAERRFESADALVAQMGRDAAETRRLLAGQ